MPYFMGFPRQWAPSMRTGKYHLIETTGDTLTDAFPISDIRVDLPNSFRFDQTIADLVNPLAVEPQRLVGLRQVHASAERPHTIFLFNDKNIDCVLECYGAYLLDVFTEDELRYGLFTAVGAVHRPEIGAKVPRSVVHYWTAYDHEISQTDPRPRSFVQYVMAGRRLAQVSGETHASVERVADGMLRLVRLANPEIVLHRRKRRHRYVLELLAEYMEAKTSYLDLIRSWCIDRTPLTKAGWEEDSRDTVAKIVRAIAGVSKDMGDVDRFLAWEDAEYSPQGRAGHSRSDNVFRYPAANPVVAVRVGSIHSVKGETHRATLVLDTFYRTHHLRALKAWIIGKKVGGAKESASTRSRLRLHYVAMSRPSHLLCLAMREDALTEAEIGKAIDMGWRVGRVTDRGTEWRER